MAAKNCLPHYRLPLVCLSALLITGENVTLKGS